MSSSNEPTVADELARLREAPTMSLGREHLLAYATVSYTHLTLPTKA